MAQFDALLPSYRDSQTDEVRMALADGDRVRGVDPCSQINLDAAAALGAITYVGPSMEPMTCTVLFDVPTEPGPDQWSPPQPRPGYVDELTVGDRAFDDGGDRGPMSLTSGHCLLWTDTGYVNPVTGAPEIVLFGIGVSHSLGQDTRSGCEDLQRIVAASREQTRNPKPRIGSAFSPQRKFMTLDPCSPLNTIDAAAGGKVVLVDAGAYPFVCKFRKPDQPDDSTDWDIRNELWSVTDLPRPQADGYREVAGEPGMNLSMSVSCTVAVYINEPFPAGTDPRSAQKQLIPVILVDSPDKPPNCDAEFAIAEAAVHSYRAS